MKRIRIDPTEYPNEVGASWWIVHPNAGGACFRLPAGATTVCTQDLEGFRSGTAYSVVSSDPHNGWVTVATVDILWDMPEYLFGLHFDAEAFVTGVASPKQLETAIPFDYRRTV